MKRILQSFEVVTYDYDSRVHLKFHFEDGKEINIYFHEGESLQELVTELLDALKSIWTI